MKKSLIAAAIAAAVAAPAANAGVVVYGKIHASIDYISADKELLGSDYEQASDDAKGWYVSSRASRIGFKGTEDLGNGLSLIWKAETTYNLDNGGWGGGRNAYIGLTGDWGTFLYGRHDTPMKISTGKLDLFGDQLGDYNWSAGPNNALLGPGFHDVRAANAIAYISPNWNGFTGAVAIVPGENNAAWGHDNNGLADSWSAAAMYSNNGLYVAAAYEVLAAADMEKSNYTDQDLVGSFNPAFSPVPTYLDGWHEDLKKWRIGAGYTMNAFTVNFVYENQKSDAMDFDNCIDGDYNADIWQVSGAYDFGNNRVKLAYGENSPELKNTNGYSCDADDTVMNGKSKHWAIGLDHKLSKRTTAYAVYAEMKADDVVIDWDGGSDERWDGGKETGFSMGLIHNF